VRPAKRWPGGHASTTFTTDAEGTYFYWAAEPGTPLEDRESLDSQLSGAFIVDAPDAKPRAERIFVISTWIQALLPDGSDDRINEVFTINGRSWPQTERLTYDLGDSVHWRVINTSATIHTTQTMRSSRLRVRNIPQVTSGTVNGTSAGASVFAT